MNANPIIRNICITVFAVICVQSCTELSKAGLEKYNPKPKSPLDGIFLLPNSYKKSNDKTSLETNPLI